MTLNPKQAVKDWLSEQWDQKVKRPIAKKTEELEGQVIQKIEEYSGETKKQTKKPLDYYKITRGFL